MTDRRYVLTIAGTLLFLGAALLLLWSAVSTSTAQLTASTSGSGSFEAGTVDLAQPESTVALLFDADGLYPGLVLPSCVTIAYDGSVPASVRLHASSTGGTGLEDFVELRLRVRRTGSCPDEAATDAAADPATGSVANAEPAAEPGIVVEPGPAPEPTPDAGGPEALAFADDDPPLVFDGLLGDLWRRHPDFADGLELIDRAEAGDRLVLEAEVELRADDDAQGRTSEFAIIIEARP